MNKFQIYRGVKHPFKRRLIAAIPALYHLVESEQRIIHPNPMTFALANRNDISDYIIKEADESTMALRDFITDNIRVVTHDQVVDQICWGRTLTMDVAEAVAYYILYDVVAVLRYAVYEEVQLQNRAAAYPFNSRGL